MPNTRVVVSSRLPGGHRRGGRLWAATQTEAEVDETLLAALQADQHLVVLIAGEVAPPAPAPPPPPTAPEKTKK